MTMSSIKSGFLTVVATGVVAGTVAYSGLIQSDMIEKSLQTGTASAKVETSDLAPKSPAKPVNPVPDENVAVVVPKPSTSKEVDTDTNETEPSSAISEPAFDVLRVEANGSILVAGRAPANSEVSVLANDGTIIAASKSGPTGDFVATPKSPLKPGDYALKILVKPTEGEETRSKETGIVRVPKQGEQSIAMISSAEAPSRILVKPKTFEKPTVEDTPQSNPDVQTSPKTVQGAEASFKLEEDLAEQNGSTEIAKTTEKTTNWDVKVPKIVAPKPRPEPELETSKPSVVVEAVELEDGKIFIAGAAPKGAAVRLYIDNEQLGLVRGTDDNRFLLTKEFSLKAGSHKVRADVVDGQSGKVLSRAEVPLIHTIEEVVKEVAVVKPKTAPPPKPVESTTPKPKKLGFKRVQMPKIEKAAEAKILAEQVPVKTGTTIIIKPGDNLWRISRRTYGRGIRYTTIYNANRDQIRNPSRIYIGQVFKIPLAEPTGSIK